MSDTTGTIMGLGILGLKVWIISSLIGGSLQQENKNFNEIAAEGNSGVSHVDTRYPGRSYRDRRTGMCESIIVDSQADTIDSLAVRNGLDGVNDGSISALYGPDGYLTGVAFCSGSGHQCDYYTSLAAGLIQVSDDGETVTTRYPYEGSGQFGERVDFPAHCAGFENPTP